MKYFLGLIAIAAVLSWGMHMAFPNLINPKHVTLVAKPWNNGSVHVWHSIVEREATFTDVRDGTRCERLDRDTHRLVGPPPAIYYYRVNCDGVIGYVEVDQAR